MSDSRTPLSNLLAAAVIVTLLPIGIIVGTLLMFGHALAPVRNVSASEIIDENVVPRGSFVKFSGTPLAGVAFTTSDKREGLSAFKEQPRLVIFSPDLHPYTREVLAAEGQESEFFNQTWDLEGRLDFPRDRVPPADKLKLFVTKDLGLKSVDDVRILYVDVKPSDYQTNLLVGGLCGAVFVLVALVSWGGVIARAVSPKRDD